MTADPATAFHSHKSTSYFPISASYERLHCATRDGTRTSRTCLNDSAFDRSASNYAIQRERIVALGQVLLYGTKRTVECACYSYNNRTRVCHRSNEKKTLAFKQYLNQRMVFDHFGFEFNVTRGRKTWLQAIFVHVVNRPRLWKISHVSLNR